MPTFGSNFQSQRDAFGRRIQFLVELDLDRCAQTYAEGGTGNCQASDLGDGSRCFYTFFTCQDSDNFSKGTITYRFCLNEVPWHTGDKVWPLLKDIVGAPQEVEDDTLSIFPEKIKAKFHFDWNPPPLDHDKGESASNSTTAGELWRLLEARHRNMVGTAKLRIKYGFNHSSIALSDFVQIGPDYNVSEFEVEDDGVKITAESPLKKLKDRKLPVEISDDNTIQDSGGINDTDTSVTVLDAGEYPDPDDYERVSVFVKIESEICEVTALNTSTNVLTITRGQWGTTAASHSEGVKVNHILALGTNDATSPTAVEPTEALQDLLEWSGIITYDAGGETATGVDTDSFDAVRDGYWPDKTILNTLSQSEKIVDLVAEIRKPRNILLYMNADGSFACEALAPGVTTMDLTEDSMVSVSSHVDQDARATRAEIRYDPASDDASSASDFNKVVLLIDSDLEGDNNFAEPKEGDQIKDRFMDPDNSIANVRNMAQRFVNRRAYGLRKFEFSLEFKEGSQLDIGDRVDITSKAVLTRLGAQKKANCVITAKKPRSANVFEFEAIDTGYGRSFARIAPDDATETYGSATDDERESGYYWSDSSGRLGDLNLFGDVYY